MKVVCIDGVKAGSSKANDGRIARPEHEIYEGETYTVVYTDTDNDGTFYNLAEKSPWYQYSARRFAPLSNIDETEFERNYNKELV